MERPVWWFLSFLTRDWLMLISSKYIHPLVFGLAAPPVVYHWCRNIDWEQDPWSQRMAGHIPGLRLWALWALPVLQLGWGLQEPNSVGAALCPSSMQQHDRAATQALVCTCSMTCRLRDNSPCSREWQPVWKTAQSWVTRQLKEDSGWWPWFGHFSVFCSVPSLLPLSHCNLLCSFAKST